MCDVDIENISSISETSESENRSRAYRIAQRRKHIKRKVRILKKRQVYQYYENVPVGKFSKGKIHCGCCLTEK